MLGQSSDLLRRGAPQPCPPRNLQSDLSKLRILVQPRPSQLGDVLSLVAHCFKKISYLSRIQRFPLKSTLCMSLETLEAPITVELRGHVANTFPRAAAARQRVQRLHVHGDVFCRGGPDPVSDLPASSPSAPRRPEPRRHPPWPPFPQGTSTPCPLGLL